MLITVVTPLFPIQAELYRGNPIYNTVLALQRHADVKVICPVSVYPPLLTPNYRYHRIDGSFRPPGVDVEYLEYRALPIFSRPFNGSICAAGLRSRLEAIPYDLVLSYWMYPEGYASYLTGREKRKPTILGARGSDLRRIKDPFTLARIKTALAGADRVLTVSEELRQRAIRLGAHGSKVHTIHNGVEHSIFHYAPMAEARRELNIPQDARLILFVGWVTPSKGVSVLTEAFVKLAADDPQLRLAIIGDGSPDYVLGPAGKAGLLDRVHILGARTGPEIALWLSAADLLCLPSFSEGCPNVILEATAAGCPVVAFSVGGVPEIVTPETGVLVSDQSPETLAQALSKALARRWDRVAIARASRRGWNEVADETFEICRETARGGRIISVPRSGAITQPPAVITQRKRLRITVVTPYFPIAEEPYRGHSAYQTLRRMKDADVEVICPVTVYPKIRWLTPSRYRYKRADLSYRPAGVKVTYFEYPALPMVTRPLNGLTCEHFLEPYLKAARPDVILNYWIYPEGFAAVRLGRKMGIPVVLGSIGSDLLRTGDPASRYLTRVALKQASGLITVSEHLRRSAIAMGVPPERVTTVLNGCDVDTFHPRDRSAARRELGVPDDAEVILYVGWLSPTKGVVELTNAATALARRRPHLKLALIGEGHYAEALEAQAEAGGIKDRVILLGRQSSADVAHWLAACDVFALPSHSEGCPNVVVEAIASGRPVVATSVGGIPELVNSECGILVPVLDTEALTNALDATLEHPWDCARIAGNFSRGWDTVAAETQEICARITGS